MARPSASDLFTFVWVQPVSDPISA